MNGPSGGLAQRGGRLTVPECAVRDSILSLWVTPDDIPHRDLLDCIDQDVNLLSLLDLSAGHGDGD